MAMRGPRLLLRIHGTSGLAIEDRQAHREGSSQKRRGTALAWAICHCWRPFIGTCKSRGRGW